MVLSDTQRQSSGHFNLVRFSSREFLCTQKSTHVLCPVSQMFPQRCLRNSSNAYLTDNGPLSSFQGRLLKSSEHEDHCTVLPGSHWQARLSHVKVKSNNAKSSCHLFHKQKISLTHIIKGTRWFWNRIACAPNWFIQWQKKCYTSIIVTTGSLCGRRSATLV